MRLFSCPQCGGTVHFENTSCAKCGTGIGYDPQANAMVAVGPNAVYCANSAHAACNWIAHDGALCRACVHNETIPDLSSPQNLANWQVIERAKKRLFYSLIRLGLPLVTRVQDPEHGLSFRFLAEEGDEPVMTGHEDGVITIALVEADDAERERRRSAMGEPYRTLLGHFRHEIAHYYWDVLVSETDLLSLSRQVFGDDSADYGDALEAYYANGAPSDWPEHFVSAYASAHAWEDFAETWAHYFHIVDTLETARSFGIIIDRTDQDDSQPAEVDFDPYKTTSARRLVANWVQVSVMLNELNRSMGLSDAYPFVISPTITGKIDAIAQIVHSQR